MEAQIEFPGLGLGATVEAQRGFPERRLEVKATVGAQMEFLGPGLGAVKVAQRGFPERRLEAKAAQRGFPEQRLGAKAAVEGQRGFPRGCLEELMVAAEVQTELLEQRLQ